MKNVKTEMEAIIPYGTRTHPMASTPILGAMAPGQTDNHGVRFITIPVKVSNRGGAKAPGGQTIVIGSKTGPTGKPLMGGGTHPNERKTFSAIFC